MNPSVPGRLLTGALILLSALTIQAQTNQVLEGFESDLSHIEVFTAYGGRSADGLVTIATHAARSRTDPTVTEGTNSVAVTIGAPGFGNDLKITLSEEASAVIHAAVATSAGGTNVARYILRYDFILPDPTKYTYFNHYAYVGQSWDYLVGGAAPANGRLSMSIALDLPTLGLPADGPVSWVIANSFGTVAPFSSPITFYLDNIRLVDTYAAGFTTPIVYPLQSFENPASPLGGATLFTGWDGAAPARRVALSRYASTGPDDVAVTDGGYALKVDNTHPGTFHADFTLPLAGTKLADLLKLNKPASQRPTPAELARYTLRWDVTFPDVPNGIYVNQLYHTGSSYLPVAQGRQEYGAISTGQRLTYSVTLDQIASWAGLPANPGLIFINDGPTTGASVYYYDNFRLLETNWPTLAVSLVSFNPTTRQLQLSWTSAPGAIYRVESSALLGPASFAPVVAGIPSGGLQTSRTVALPQGNSGFVRVVQE